MAKPGAELIAALRKAALNISGGADYQWGHMGSCNCGHLAQEITKLSRAEIHARAMKRKGDWNDQCDDFCSTSGFPIDDLISELLNAGLDIEDLKHLENLSDPTVLRELPLDKRNLIRNKSDDVVLYMNAWANMLESHMMETVSLDELWVNELTLNAENY